MHPLAIFPSLLTFSIIAPFLLRLAIGILLLLAGMDRYKKEYNWASFFYFASGLLLIVGLYTQIAVLVAIACVKFGYFMEKKSGPVSREKMTLSMLMVIILISLLLTGPGFLAFDLPL